MTSEASASHDLPFDSTAVRIEVVLPRMNKKFVSMQRLSDEASLDTISRLLPLLVSEILQHLDKEGVK